MAAPKQTDPQFKLRMPQGLKDDLEKAVENSGRTLNAEIVWRLEHTFKQDRQWEEQKRIAAIERPKSQAAWAEYEASTHPLDVAARQAQEAQTRAIRAKVHTDLYDQGLLTQERIEELRHKSPEVYDLVRLYIEGLAK